MRAHMRDLKILHVQRYGIFLCAINSGNFFGDLIIFINSRKMFGLKK